MSKDISKARISPLSSSDPGNRPLTQDVLPFGKRPSGSKAGRTMEESVYAPAPKKSHLPPEAPNILIVLIDDAGPGTPDTYGGEVHTPNLTRIAGQGLSYGTFHSTAMCSPTRSALLTGRNHTRVGNGQISELGNDWDGFTGLIPKTSAMTAEVLRQYGYSTAAFGKWHMTPATECSKAGPFDNWPTGSGFEYFYGFLGGETSQWEPFLVKNTTYVDPPKTPEQGLSRHRGPGGQRHRVASQPSGSVSGQALLHVLRHGSRSWTASGPQRMGGQVQGKVRRRMGCLP